MPSNCHQCNKVNVRTKGVCGYVIVEFAPQRAVFLNNSYKDGIYKITKVASCKLCEACYSSNTTNIQALVQTANTKVYFCTENNFDSFCKTYSILLEKYHIGKGKFLNGVSSIVPNPEVNGWSLGAREICNVMLDWDVIYVDKNVAAAHTNANNKIAKPNGKEEKQKRKTAENKAGKYSDSEVRRLAEFHKIHPCPEISVTASNEHLQRYNVVQWMKRDINGVSFAARSLDSYRTLYVFYIVLCISY